MIEVRPNVAALKDEELAELAAVLPDSSQLKKEILECQAYRARYRSPPTASTPTS